MPWLRILLLIAMGILAGCTNQIASNEFSAVSPAATGSTPSAASSSVALPDYLLSPGDLLEISVFQVPDLTREVQVDESGSISLPLIGDIKAGGMTTRSLQAEITKRLKAKYMQSPQVSVFLKSSAGQQVTVDGAVKTPGVFPIEGRMTLVQALARSGGLTPVGDPSAVLVFRHANGRQMAAKFNVDDIEAGKAADPNLDAGDMVVVDTSGTRSLWQNAKETLPLFGVFAYVTAALL